MDDIADLLISLIAVEDIAAKVYELGRLVAEM
jgi:hypothetical protein